jgi:hypothetical protein
MAVIIFIIVSVMCALCYRAGVIKGTEDMTHIIYMILQEQEGDESCPTSKQ